MEVGGIETGGKLEREEKKGKKRKLGCGDWRVWVCDGEEGRVVVSEMGKVEESSGEEQQRSQLRKGVSEN